MIPLISEVSMMSISGLTFTLGEGIAIMRRTGAEEPLRKRPSAEPADLDICVVN